MAEQTPLPVVPGSTMDVSLAPIEQTPLKRQIAERLRRAIVTGRLRPGTVLVETALAEQLNVSRAPIREAVQILDHALLAQLWAGLYLQIHQIMSLRNDRDVNLIDIAANHPPIVRALAARDGALAERLIAEHTHALASFDPASVAEHLP